MKTKKFSIIKRFESFKFALNGFKIIWMYEHNFRIHILFAILAITCGYYLELTKIEFIILLFTIFLVLFAEIINSSIEYLADSITLEKNDSIKNAKDIAASFVLLSAIFSIGIGFILFVPKLIGK